MYLIKYTTAGTATYDSETGPDTGRVGCYDHYMIFDNEMDLADFYAADPEAFLEAPKVIAELSEREAAELFCQLRTALNLTKAA